MKPDTINFLKQIAADYGHTITDEEALRAHQIISDNIDSDEDYYYEAKSYFQN